MVDKSIDTAGDVVFATAGGQLSTVECYGKTCTIPPYVHNSSVTAASLIAIRAMMLDKVLRLLQMNSLGKLDGKLSFLV